MNNEHTEKIKHLMCEFEKINDTINLEQGEQKEYKINNLDPHLIGYIFSNVLNFNVDYRPIEKVNYFIKFIYKGNKCVIVHAKLSFKLYCRKEIATEILEIFKESIKMMEQALLTYSEEAVANNDYSLPNRNTYYKNKICVIENDISDTILQSKKLETELEKKREKLIASGRSNKTIVKEKRGKYSIIETPLDKLINKYSDKIDDLEIRLSYLVELYIDNYFSYIEHFLSLLIPMTDEYNEKEQYAKILGYDWNAKLQIINKDGKRNAIIEDLSRIKDIYRNRFAHGLFSREKLVNVMIKDFGAYPLWIGKRYCKGYKGVSNRLTSKHYDECKEIFEKLFLSITEEYELQVNIIEAGIPTFLKKQYYKDSLENEQKNSNWIESYWYHQDNVYNMDW